MTYLSAETTEKSIPEVAQREREVLIEEVPQKTAHPIIRPSSVYQQ